MFAPLVAKAQKAAMNPTSKLAPKRSTLEARPLVDGGIEQAHKLQRSIGNQATLRLLSQQAQNVTENEPHHYNERKTDPASLTARRATPGVSWDFSKIPLFPADRADRPQPSPPFVAAPLLGAAHAKLVVGRVNDPREHEADRVADEVMRMSEPAPIGKAPAMVQRRCAACEEEPQTTEPLVQSVEDGEEEFPPGAQTAVLRKAEFGTPPAVTRSLAAVAGQLLARRSGGNELQAGIRQRMEGAFGRDFSRVRVHHDTEAHSFCLQLGALAFTQGSDIFFGNGVFDPGGSSGARVLAHELTHVVQQGQADPRNQRGSFGSVAGQVISGGSHRGSDPMIQRLATWTAGTVHEVNNLANSIINGGPVGRTMPMLNGTAFIGGVAARGLIAKPTLTFTNVPAPAPEPAPAPGPAPAPAPAAKVNATVATVPTNTGSFDETVLAPGPWSVVTTKANVGAHLPTLAACTGAGNSTFSANGKPTDAAMFAANRRHENHHAADDEVAFNASLGAWDTSLTAAEAGHIAFPGATNAEAEAALFAAMGGTPDKIADAYWNQVDAAGAAFHATPKGGTVSAFNPTSDATCSTSAVDATNPS